MKTLKQWLKSKSIWWNTVGMPTTIGILQLTIENIELVKANLGWAYGVTLFFMIIVSNYLRSITTGALSDK